jgi:hypothetical protein
MLAMALARTGHAGILKSSNFTDSSSSPRYPKTRQLMGLPRVESGSNTDYDLLPVNQKNDLLNRRIFPVYPRDGGFFSPTPVLFAKEAEVTVILALPPNAGGVP